jgi:hypothetical protein
VRVPSEAALGVAKINVSFESWKQVHVEPASGEIPVIEGASSFAWRTWAVVAGASALCACVCFMAWTVFCLRGELRGIRLVALLAAAVLLVNGGIYYCGIGFGKWSGSADTRLDFIAVSAFLCGQLVLVAAWSALSRARWVLRAPAVVIAMWLSSLRVLHLGRDTREGAVVRHFFLAAGTLLVFLSARAVGLGLECGDNVPPGDTTNQRKDLQFSLADMLVSVAVAALLLALMRVVSEAVIAALAMVAIISAWAVLARTHLWLRLLVLTVVSVLVAFSLDILYQGGLRAPSLFSVVFTATFALVVSGGFLVCRLSGYRLVRRSGTRLLARMLE